MSKKILIDTSSDEEIRVAITENGKLDDFEIESKKKNAEIIYGYEMLLGQASRSFEIWLKEKAPYEAMKKSILGGF